MYVRPPPVITTDSQAAADWEPEEAIVVCLLTYLYCSCVC